MLSVDPNKKSPLIFHGQQNNSVNARVCRVRRVLFDEENTVTSNSSTTTTKTKIDIAKIYKFADEKDSIYLEHSLQLIESHFQKLSNPKITKQVRERLNLTLLSKDLSLNEKMIETGLLYFFIFDNMEAMEEWLKDDSFSFYDYFANALDQNTERLYDYHVELLGEQGDIAPSGAVNYIQSSFAAVLFCNDATFNRGGGYALLKYLDGLHFLGDEHRKLMRHVIQGLMDSPTFEEYVHSFEKLNLNNIRQPDLIYLENKIKNYLPIQKVDVLRAVFRSMIFDLQVATNCSVKATYLFLAHNHPVALFMQTASCLIFGNAVVDEDKKKSYPIQSLLEVYKKKEAFQKNKLSGRAFLELSICDFVIHNIDKEEEVRETLLKTETSTIRQLFQIVSGGEQPITARTEKRWRSYLSSPIQDMMLQTLAFLNTNRERPEGFKDVFELLSSHLKAAIPPNEDFSIDETVDRFLIQLRSSLFWVYRQNSKKIDIQQELAKLSKPVNEVQEIKLRNFFYMDYLSLSSCINGQVERVEDFETFQNVLLKCLYAAEKACLQEGSICPGFIPLRFYMADPKFLKVLAGVILAADNEGYLEPLDVPDLLTLRLARFPDVGMNCTILITKIFNKNVSHYLFEKSKDEMHFLSQYITAISKLKKPYTSSPLLAISNTHAFTAYEIRLPSEDTVPNTIKKIMVAPGMKLLKEKEISAAEKVAVVTDMQRTFPKLRLQFSTENERAYPFFASLYNQIKDRHEKIYLSSLIRDHYLKIDVEDCFLHLQSILNLLNFQTNEINVFENIKAQFERNFHASSPKDTTLHRLTIALQQAIMEVADDHFLLDEIEFAITTHYSLPFSLTLGNLNFKSGKTKERMAPTMLRLSFDFVSKSLKFFEHHPSHGDTLVPSSEYLKAFTLYS